MTIEFSAKDAVELFSLLHNEKNRIEREVSTLQAWKDMEIENRKKIEVRFLEFIKKLQDELYREDINDEIMLYNVRKIVQAEYDNDLPF